MHAASDNLAFAPPPEPAALRGFVLAILAHLALMAALTWGINWKKDSDIAGVEAELWAAVPEQAAPVPVVAPVPVPEPRVVQAPPIVEKVAPPPPVVQEPDIAIEREKRKRDEAKVRQLELKERKELEARKQKQLQEEEDRRERVEQAKLAKEKAKRELETKARLEAERQKNIDKMLASAGTGAPSATGTALRSKGPSATYAGRIAARIKPNIVFAETISGNPAAEIVIRVAPDGTIVSAKPLKSSGVKSWDDAVLRAVEKTEKIPRDTDGTVVPEFTISFRPKD